MKRVVVAVFGILAAVLMGCRTAPVALPRVIRVATDRPLPDFSTAHDSKPYVRIKEFRFRSGDDALSIHDLNPYFGTSLLLRTSSEYTLTLAVTPRGKPLWIDYMVPEGSNTARGSLVVLSSQPFAPDFEPFESDIWIDRQKIAPECLLEQWCVWMKDHEQLRISVLE